MAARITGGLINFTSAQNQYLSFPVSASFFTGRPRLLRNSTADAAESVSPVEVPEGTFASVIPSSHSQLSSFTFNQRRFTPSRRSVSLSILFLNNFFSLSNDAMAVSILDKYVKSASTCTMSYLIPAFLYYVLPLGDYSSVSSFFRSSLLLEFFNPQNMCKSRIAREWEVSVKHIYMEKNRAAGVLAFEALSYDRGTRTIRITPARLQEIMKEDKMAMSIC